MPKVAGFPALVSVAMLTGVVLTGCSSDDADRNASIVSSKTRVCVINDSPSRTELTFLSADEVTGDTILWENMGDKGCGTGGGSMARTDVAIGILTTGPDARWIVRAGNPALGSPGVVVEQQVNSRLYSCINDAFEVNQSNSYDDGFVTFTAKRLPDTDVKNFEVRITESTNPSSTGDVRMCRKTLS